MKSLNKFMGIGNLGNDPEMRFTPDGKAVVNFTMAMNNRNAEGTETTEWIDLTLWGKIAETMNTILRKGMAVFVEGRLHTRQWEKDGVKQYRTGVIVNNIIILTPRAGNAPDDDTGEIEPDELPDNPPAATGKGTPPAKATPTEKPVTGKPVTRPPQRTS